MTSSHTTNPSADGATLNHDDRVDAIRYAVLRKLAPGLRHALMGEMQAIQLSAEYALRTLDAGTKFAEARNSIGDIAQHCSNAVKTGRSLIEWIGPEEEVTASVGECVERCLRLAGEDWLLRGIEATTDLPNADAQLPKAMLQELLVTALLVLTDIYDQPADLRVVVRARETHIEIVVDGRAANRTASIPPLRQYRKLTWSDLALLASARGVSCVCEGSSASLQFRRGDPT